MSPVPENPEGPRRYVLASESEVVRTICFHCGKRLRVRSVHTDKFVRCPRCKKRTQVIVGPATDWEGDADEETQQPGLLRRLIVVWIVLAAALCIGVGLMVGRLAFS